MAQAAITQQDFKNFTANDNNVGAIKAFLASFDATNIRTLATTKIGGFLGSGGESYLTHVIGKTINEFVAEQQGNNIESNTCSIKKVEGLLLVLNKCQQSGMQDDELIGILHNASHGKNHLGALVPNAVAIITQIIIDHYAPTQEGEHLDAFKVNIQGYGIGLNGDSKILVPDQTKIVEYNLWHDAGYVVHAEAHEVGVAGGDAAAAE